MALKYYYEGYEYTHEDQQFEVLLTLLNNYFLYKNKTAYFIGFGERKINNKALDALLILPEAVIGIEFKSYGNDGDIAEVTDNGVDPWYVYDSNGNPKHDNDGNLLYVKGGTDGKIPNEQASINRRGLTSSLLEFDQDSGYNAIKDKNEISIHTPYFIVFNKELIIRENFSRSNKLWLKVTTNNSFIHALEECLKDKTTLLSDKEIVAFLDRWGFREFHDASDWSTHKATVIQRKKQKEQITFTPTNVYGIKPSQSNVFTQLSGKYKKLAQKGDMAFLFLISFAMTLTIAKRWWWDTQDNIVNIAIMFVVAFFVGLFFVISSSHKTRAVPVKGELIDDMPQIIGLNIFSYGSVIFSHLSWLGLSAILCIFADPIRDFIPNNSEAFYGAFYGLLRIMCILLKTAGYVMGSITLASFIFRILSINNYSSQNNSPSSFSFLTMMPCTRSDINIDNNQMTEYWYDLWRWFKNLIKMSAYITIIWVLLTFIFDSNLFKSKYNYWPMTNKTETNVKPSKQAKEKEEEQEDSIPGRPHGTVRPTIIKIQQLEFNKPSIKLGYGESYDLRKLLIIEPQDATEPLSGSVADRKYLSITETGIVTSRMSEDLQFIVTVTSKIGKHEASIMINSK